jgi:hypothetical protein
MFCSAKSVAEHLPDDIVEGLVCTDTRKPERTDDQKKDQLNAVKDAISAGQNYSIRLIRDVKAASNQGVAVRNAAAALAGQNPAAGDIERSENSVKCSMGKTCYELAKQTTEELNAEKAAHITTQDELNGKVQELADEKKAHGLYKRAANKELADEKKAHAMCKTKLTKEKKARVAAVHFGKELQEQLNDMVCTQQNMVCAQQNMKRKWDEMTDNGSKDSDDDSEGDSGD